MGRSLLRRTARCYRNESIQPIRAALTVEPGPNRICALPALIDRPHDQRLAAPRVPGSEHSGGRGQVARRRGVATRIALDVELIEQFGLRPEESHCEQNELGG